MGPNDFLQEEGFSLTQCCFGSGGRALYDVWYFASQEDAEAVRVNLQFSKRLPSALVISYMPGKAVLEIQMTKDKQLLVRKPGWADVTKTRILVGGQEHKPLMKGTYFDLGRLDRGAQVRVEFPEELMNKKERIGDVEFSTVWRGNAVVKMAPAGEFYPLYQQGRDRTDGVMPIPYINPHPINPF